jgi:hypothetical protein
MKKIALISTFCDTKEKEDILYENILTLKKLGIDVMGIGPKTIHLPNSIVKEFDYFFYTKDNPLLTWPIRDFSFWKSFFTKKGFIKLHHSVDDYGWSALYHVKKLSQIALTFDYDIFYHLIYDVEIDEELQEDIKSNVVNRIHPRRDPNNPETLWETTLHFMVFNREMMEIIEREITLESYLSTDGVAEGEVLKWKNKFNIETSGHPVKDKIYYWGDKDFFNLSPFPGFKLFISKNSTDYIQDGETPPNKQILPDLLRVFFHDFSEIGEIDICVNGISYKISPSPWEYIEFPISSQSIEKITFEYEGNLVDYTNEYSKISRNLIYYVNKS